MQTSHGMTMIEQLSALAITSILVSLSISSFSFVEQLRADSAARDVQSFVLFARTQALALSESVYVCPSQDAQSCSRPWATKLVAYQDLNQNKDLDSADQILRTINLAPQKTRIKWRAFGNKKSLQFIPEGITNYHNGTFTLCPDSNEPTLARNIILNVAGRAYLGKDSNQNGVAESASGVDISCL